jgi:hypothetical protein
MVFGNEALSLYQPLLGPGIGYHNKKEVIAMASKDKKEPKATTPPPECGCGCLPVKK